MRTQRLWYSHCRDCGEHGEHFATADDRNPCCGTCQSLEIRDVAESPPGACAYCDEIWAEVYSPAAIAACEGSTSSRLKGGEE